MGPIQELAKLYQLSIIEDSCETMFAKYGDRCVGSLGDIGCFSTYVAHFLVTGVGGFATTNDPELAVSMRSLMNHGRDSIYISCTDDQGVPKARTCRRSSKSVSRSSTSATPSAARRWKPLSVSASLPARNRSYCATQADRGPLLQGTCPVFQCVATSDLSAGSALILSCCTDWSCGRRPRSAS